MPRNAKRPYVIDLSGSSTPRSKVARSQEESQLSSPTSSLPPNFQPSNSNAADDDWVEDDIDSNPSQQYLSSQDYSHYGSLGTKIVGVRYYSGLVTAGEMVLVRREPNNQYDANAIQVLNVGGKQIGHIGREVASKLAKFMDQKKLFVEGHATGAKGAYDCPITLDFFGSSDPDKKSSLEKEIKSARIPIDNALDRDGLDAKECDLQQKQLKAREKEIRKAQKEKDAPDSQWAPSSIPKDGTALTINEIIADSEKFSPRSFDEMVEKFGLPGSHLQSMAMAEQPEAIKSTLLPYQRQGLAWMLEKESPQLPPPKSKETTQLWQRIPKSNLFTNIATKYSTPTSPFLASGGILTDDMGLGKTIQVISLILASPKLPKVNNGYSSSTLIFAPLSVMSNWAQQIERHVKEKHALKTLIYHGATRRQNAKNLQDYDVVVTTYDTARCEFHAPNRSKTTGLHSVKWRRIVLDEGHTIRNPAAKTSTAIYALKAESRWVLTGTPIFNALKDLYSLVRFLGLTGGIDQWELFNSAIVRPLNAGMDRAGEILQALMKSICLRRTKEMKFIDLKLPELSEYIHRVEFYPHEIEQYNALEAQAKGRLEEYQQARNKKGSSSSSAYQHLLEVLLRLRQLCNHWQLVGQQRIELVAGGEGKEGKCLELTAENRKLLEGMLQLHVESQDDCPICLDTAKDPVITLCTHVFCFACIEKVIELQKKCPMCRAPLESSATLLRLPSEGDDSKDDKVQFNEVSSKLEALMSILKASAKDKSNKTVVFSQWTSFLNVVEPQLVKNEIRFVRIDGTMLASQRDAALTALESDASVTVLLASLGCCSVGLNLVSANQVVLADSWWAPAIEDQAVDRVHRLGQTRPTSVFRLIVSNTIEERILDLQKKKRKLMMLALGEKKSKRGNEKGTRLADIQTLLG